MEPSVFRQVTPKMLRRPTDWTFSDYDEYAQWYGFFISLDMLDPASLNGPQLRPGNASGMEAVRIDEVTNAAAQCAAYCGYLSTAAGVEVQTSLGELLPEYDKFMALAHGEPLLAISTEAPWPVEHAAHVLAIELLRGERRRAQTQGAAQPGRKIADYTVRVSPEKAVERLRGHNVVLLAPEDERLARALGAPEVRHGASGVIATAKPDAGTQNVTIFVRGASKQHTLYLVDYLLDLSWTLLHARWPIERNVETLKELWAGWKLILNLRKMHGKEAVAYARKVPYSHVATRKADSAKYDAGQQGIRAGASELEWWQHFLLELRLPDDRQVPDMIDKSKKIEGAAR